MKTRPSADALEYSDGTVLRYSDGTPLEFSANTSGETLPPNATVGSAPAQNSSSAWTGRRTTEEQRLVIIRIAPVARDAIGKLIDDLNEGRPNETESLDELRQLHHAIGELIKAYESGAGRRKWMQSAWDHTQRFVGRSDDAFTAVTRSPTYTVSAMAMLGYLFDVDLTTAIFSGIISGYIKNPQR